MSFIMNKELEIFNHINIYNYLEFILSVSPKELSQLSVLCHLNLLGTRGDRDILSLISILCHMFVIADYKETLLLHVYLSQCS